MINKIIKHLFEKKLLIQDETSNVQSKPIGNCGVVLNGHYSDSKEYCYYLRFNISIRFNNLNPINHNTYSEEQLQRYRLIKSLYDKGMGYRKISVYLNDRGILTENGSQWGVTGNYVYSVLKRFKEREERLKFRKKKYQPIRSKMWLEYNKIN